MTEQVQTEQPSLLIVDDDKIFCEVLSEAMAKRGYTVTTANNVDEGLELARKEPPEYAVIDLKMPGKSGLEMVTELKKLDEHTRMVVLTGYASIATAVEAIKLGAIHYLAKPADADDIMAAFFRDQGNKDAPIRNKPLSVGQVEWEHIHKVLTECDGNISETARRLNMHRRTLQRKLAKYPVKN
ncbi:MAG: response regulator transcription factor [Gammaproteobacteria bacterium]|nr:response regulator transcription factor [Gammaproteobacteria bacterium]MDH5593162.1 response regulator transcription factor [Gammaproteobacteria bacterium]